jgi:hypothetical protein
MKLRPRFKLRTLFVLITLLSIPLGWSGYQLNWIRQRHTFLVSKVRGTYDPGGLKAKKFPWTLRLFGEHPQSVLVVPEEEMATARALFPEANVFEAGPQMDFPPIASDAVGTLKS